MEIPKFLLGSHSAVTRASVRAAESIVAGQSTVASLGSESVDTSSNDERIALEVGVVRKGFLLYAFMGAVIDHHATVRDESFCRRLVEECLENDWSVICLAAPTSVSTTIVKRSGLAWEYLEALDRAWPAAVSLGTRFNDAIDPLWFSQNTTILPDLLRAYGVPREKSTFRQGMNAVHALLRDVLSGPKRALSPQAPRP